MSELQHVIISCNLWQGNRSFQARAMIDCGATGIFIEERFCTNNKLEIIPMKPQGLTLFDGKPSSAGPMTHYVAAEMDIGAHREQLDLKITRLGDYDLVLGLPWLRQHNPNIDWANKVVSFETEYCKKECLRKAEEEEYQRIWAVTTEEPPTKEQLVPKKYHDFLDVFDKATSEQLPPHRPYDCKIELTPGSTTRHGPIYPMSEVELKALREYIDEQLAKGYIRPSTSPAGAPVFFIKKKDKSLRLVVDYRQLNTITVKNRYPLPLIPELVERLQGAKYFTKMDLRWGYNLVRIAEGDEWKTAFKCRYGHFEYLVMPFGLCNAPAVFQHLMNDIFGDMLDHGVVIYLDDIMVYGKTIEEVEALTREVLRRLRKHGLFVKPEKCEFEKLEAEYVGLFVSEQGIKMDPHKTDAIAEWPAPKSVKELQMFLGFANYYRRFITNFSKICRQMHNLLKKDTKYIWGDLQQLSFEQLKYEFTKAPVLIHPDPKKQFFVETDASGYAMGGQLSQVGADGRRHPVAFYSKSMVPAERNYDIYDKELLAVVRCFQEWRHHLEGATFTVVVLTDHNNLRWFLSTKTLTGRQARWAEFLAGFDFIIQYRPGVAAGIPDALSRRPDHMPQDAVEREHRIFTEEQFLNATKVVHQQIENALIGEIRRKQSEDEYAIYKRQYLLKKGNKLADHDLEDNLLFYKGKVYIPKDFELRKKILELYHDSKPAGHQGPKGTQQLISRYYTWPTMAKDIEAYVQGCDTCQRVKASRHAPYGELQPLPIPSGRWRDIAYDFITGLPECEGKDAILVVVDRMSKGAHFIPCTTNETSESTARLFYENVWKLHGTPERTVSDRGTQFNTHFLKRLYELLGIDPAFSTAYHPESDGQSERVNQMLEDYLRMFVSHRQNNWVQLLPSAEFQYNNHQSASTGYSPFYMWYGENPAFLVGMPNNLEEIVPGAEQLARKILTINKEASAMISLAQERYKEQADRHRTSPQFEVGEKVYLNRKNITTDRPTPKLDYRWLGPYTITEKIGKVAYRLALPHTMKVHNVFHINLLKKEIPDKFKRAPIPLPPVITPDGEEEYEVERILNSRTNKKGDVSFLVRWKAHLPSEDSWQTESDVRNAKQAIEEFYLENPNAPKKGETTRTTKSGRYVIPARKKR